jgi:transposase InsO family protein
VVELANEYMRIGRGTKSVKAFCERYPDLLARLDMNYRQALGWLRKLGFVSRRGIFLKNKGLDKILRFRPNQVWGSDGKRLVVIINGEIFEWVWQCLVDGKTTVIVGGMISGHENTANLLAAIEESKSRTGITPLAIVLDNRLSEDMPAIRAYLDEKGIEIIKIFPGNSKSNGIVEGNFCVFDKWVGSIVINGKNPEELSRSIATAFVEVFTQMRNHARRSSLSNKSAQQIAEETEAASPEEEAETRAKLKALADRHKREQAQPEISEQKRIAIQQAAEVTNHPHPEVLDNRLAPSCFTADLILQSIAIFKQQKALHPEKGIGHAYYGGILRNLADQQRVEALNIQLEAVYVNHWETMERLSEEGRARALKRDPLAACTRLAADFMTMPIPAYCSRLLLDLKETFFIACKGSAALAGGVRKAVADFIVAAKYQTAEKREALLLHLFEWENFLRLCDMDADNFPSFPSGRA